MVKAIDICKMLLDLNLQQLCYIRKFLDDLIARKTADAAIVTYKSLHREER